MVRSILVPTDFSEGSLAALDEALALADSLKVKPQITLVHVWTGNEIRMPDLTLRTKDARVLLDEARAHGLVLEHAAQFLAALEARGLVLDAWMMTGPPAETIATTAGEGGFDLVVMGTHGRTGLRSVMGSVAEKVVRLSVVPVMTVRIARRASRELGSVTEW